MDNLYIYEQSHKCPDNAVKPIVGGKLKGMSDINPMWRIKKLTELFGPCGVGWKLSNIRYWTEPGAGGEVSAWCSLQLHYKVDGAWSEGVDGVGGSMLVNTEKGKLVTNDEAFKMAETDAISVACKMLGVAADVYWNADRTKYSGNEGPDGGNSPPPPPPAPEPPLIYCTRCGKKIHDKKAQGKIYTAGEIADKSLNSYDRVMCWNCMKEVSAERAAAAREGF